MNMETAEHTTRLNKAQLNILRLLGNIKTEEEADELRQVICDFYARKVDEEMDRLWDEGKWSQEKIDEVMREHLRTPYRYARG